MSDEEVTKPKRRAAGRPAGPPVDDKVSATAEPKKAAKKAPIAAPLFQAAHSCQPQPYAKGIFAGPCA